MLVAIERREQRPLGGAVVGLDVNDVHPDIPLAERALVKAGIGGMVGVEDEEGNQFCKQLRWGLGNVRATFRQAEFALEVSPEARLGNSIRLASFPKSWDSLNAAALV